MLIIRLRRVGKKNKPTYRVVVAEHSYPVDGKFTADLGFYNPHTKKIGINIEDAKLWLSKGAKPSNTVAKLLQKEKVKHGSVAVKERNRKPKNEQAEKPAAAPAAAPAEEVTEETAAEATEEALVEEATSEVTEEAPAEESA